MLLQFIEVLLLHLFLHSDVLFRELHALSDDSIAAKVVSGRVVVESLIHLLLLRRFKNRLLDCGIMKSFKYFLHL